MKTGSGIEIKEEDLIANFFYNEKSCQIGKFDPIEYPELKNQNLSWEVMDIFVYDQLEDSGLFSDEDLSYLAIVSTVDFTDFIQEK